jgi:predicted MFS family arabinose efflux permease
MGTVVSANGLGLLLGPVISSIIFDSFGYGFTFVFFALVLSLAALLA